MQVESNTTTRILDEYDITFSNGKIISISICKAEGDSADFDSNPNRIQFHITEKKESALDGSDIPAQSITVYTSQILTIQHHTRTVRPPSAEQREAWKKTIKDALGVTDLASVSR